MRTIKVKKAELLARIKENRERHLQAYKEACKGYKEETVSVLYKLQELINQELAKLSSTDDTLPDPILRPTQRGVEHYVNTSLEKPRHHQRAYNQVIEMLEMETSEEVEVSADEFACYVQDDWTWKQDFLKMSSTYRK